MHTLTSRGPLKTSRKMFTNKRTLVTRIWSAQWNISTKCTYVRMLRHTHTTTLSTYKRIDTIVSFHCLYTDFVHKNYITFSENRGLLNSGPIQENCPPPPTPKCLSWHRPSLFFLIPSFIAEMTVTLVIGSPV